MNVARVFFVAALVVGTAQFASGHDGHDRARAGQKPANRDQLRIAVQDICPVSGQKLGSMGTPVKVQVGTETVFLCCKGCMQQKIKPAHWATIHANYAKAQRICPVMKKKLPNSPKWTIVQGQIIYVCCPSCVKKIAANPTPYLQTVDRLYMAALNSKQLRR